MNMKNRLTSFLLIAIIVLAAGLRLYKLDSVPPALSWDEAAFGVNAYYLANYGRDEYGKFLPMYFRSFGDDKHPVHIYITSLFVKMLGLTEFSVRLPSALFGIFSVLLIFFLAKLLFKSELVGLISSLFLAISPYNIHFSRFNHEANFTLFFFLLALLLFFLSFNKRGYLLPFSVLSFGITYLSYHSSKVVVPVIVLILLAFYFKKLLQNKKGLIVTIFVSLLFVLIIIVNPQLLGLARASQNSLDDGEIEKTALYQSTDNKLLGRLNLIFNQYTWHFDPQFLFIQGDKNHRLSSQTGQFYKIDAILLILGVVYLIYRRSRVSLLLIIWALIAPLPSSLVKEAPHAARASFMMGSWHLVSALGFYLIISLVRKPIFRWGAVIITLAILTSFLINYLKFYYTEYAKRYAIEWQYGMKQIVEYIGDHPEYNQVYMTDVRHQPYIFFLFYLKTPLPDYLNTVYFNRSESSVSYNLVSFYDKYFFGGWDVVESMPNSGVLYIVTPSEYDGLHYKKEFSVKKLINYPDGTSAFYLVSKD